MTLDDGVGLTATVDAAILSGSSRSIRPGSYEVPFRRLRSARTLPSRRCVGCTSEASLSGFDCVGTDRTLLVIAPSKPVRCGSPTLGRFDSGAAPLSRFWRVHADRARSS